MQRYGLQELQLFDTASRFCYLLERFQNNNIYAIWLTPTQTLAFQGEDLGGGGLSIATILIKRANSSYCSPIEEAQP